MRVPCEKCGVNVATERHHLFSQTKWAKKLYGGLIHHPSNLQNLCYDCHHNKPVDKQTEQEFCDNIGIKVRSKSGGIYENTN